ncbi:hypothetical protein C6Y14_23170 [Streptomyces dioscori]|uniref:DUF7144 domain-containing protein n=1 Tax=Streptomyces dioscori TaxID=2109333 RepID=A0A2P8Q3T6_9ACTN|nr:hypothetical protein [Streptomyces dioscori]PSM40911.1 hypothetical protein C6Y14_23170 [Streptomyces dioscori]
MAEQTSAGQTRQGSPPQEPRIKPLMVGGVVFAVCMMAIVGAYQVFVGMGALMEDNFYTRANDYPYDLNINVWGWVHLISGIVIVAAAFSVFKGKTWARVVGITVAALSAMENFFFTPYYPLWSIVIIAFDVLIIWSLASYGHAQAHKVYGAPM